MNTRLSVASGQNGDAGDTVRINEKQAFEGAMGLGAGLMEIAAAALKRLFSWHQGRKYYGCLFLPIK